MFGRTENQDWCHIQVIGVTAPERILLCAIAASGTGSTTTATFNGCTSTGTNVSTNATLPPWQTYTNVTLDTTWQPLTSISIVTRGMILGSSPHKHAMNAPHFYPNASVPIQRPSCAKCAVVLPSHSMKLLTFIVLKLLDWQAEFQIASNHTRW